MPGGEEDTPIRPFQANVDAGIAAPCPDLPLLQLKEPPIDFTSAPPLTDHIEFNSMARTVEEYKFSGKKALTSVLEQLTSYLQARVASDELELFCLSLHHLFNNLDTLYCHALASLNDSAYAARSISESGYDLYSRQHIWTHLQVIRRVMRSIEPLCKLLATMTSTLLGDLEASDQFRGSGFESWAALGNTTADASWLQMPEDVWEQMEEALCESVGCWQQSLANQPLLVEQFAQSAVPRLTLERLDSLFKGMLESAVALFGDILPGFHLVIWNGDIELAAHLLDLAQQVDHILFLSDRLRDPLLLFLDCFGAIT